MDSHSNTKNVRCGCHKTKVYTLHRYQRRVKRVYVCLQTIEMLIHFQKDSYVVHVLLKKDHNGMNGDDGERTSLNPPNRGRGYNCWKPVRWPSHGGSCQPAFHPYEHVSLAHSTGVPRDHNNIRVSHDYQIQLKPDLQTFSAKTINSESIPAMLIISKWGKGVERFRLFMQSLLVS